MDCTEGNKQEQAFADKVTALLLIHSCPHHCHLRFFTQSVHGARPPPLTWLAVAAGGAACWVDWPPQGTWAPGAAAAGAAGAAGAACAGGHGAAAAAGDGRAPPAPPWVP